MTRPSAARALCVPILAGCLAACTGWSAALVHVDTASAAVAAYAERYNLAQERYRVVTRFVDGPAERLARGGSAADVLIGPGLASGELAGRLRPLDRLFRTGRLGAAAFFPSLLTAGRPDGAQTALPLSFRVPVVVVRAGDEALPPFAVTPEQLAAPGSAALGWDAELVLRAAVHYGADFRVLPDGRIGLEQAAVDRAVAQARGLAAAAEERRAIGGLVTMLLDERIDFFVTDLPRLADLPQARRERLAIRWLGHPELLRPDDPTYAAIRAGARNPRGARAFLLWLFDPATQTALLDVGGSGRAAGFGIAGGLPALIDVARQEVAPRYPFLLGRVPTAAELAAPAALGVRWEALRDAVVLPWLRQALRDAERPPLAQAIAAWRQQRILAPAVD